MTLRDDDLLLIGRGSDIYRATVQELGQKITNGFTGDVVVDGTTLTFINGLLISATP